MDDTFYLVQSGDAMPRWCTLSVLRDGAVGYVDLKGRAIPVEGARPLAHVVGTVADTVGGVPGAVADLERSWAYRKLLDPWSDQGWLSPSGRFYGCRFFEHDDIAHALLRRHVGQLEESGFVRVHADSFRVGGSRRRGVTQAQAEALFEMGFDDPSPPGRRRAMPDPDRHAPPPRRAVLPPGFALAPRPLPPASPSDVVRRLAGLSGLEALEGAAGGIETDLGGGYWSWMAEVGDVFLGGEEADWLMAAEGLHLSLASFDQVEVSAWPRPGLHAEPDALALLAGALCPAAPSP